MDLDWYVIWGYRADLVRGLWLTCQISAITIVAASLLGLGVGCLRSQTCFWAQRLSGLYVAVMRNIPVVPKLFFAHFILGLDALPAGIVVLVLHQSAYIADVVAAGLRSVARGQAEAAKAAGFSGWQVFSLILLPQALPAMLPPMTTQYTQIVKNSSVVMLIALQDLTFMIQKIEHETFRGFEAATTVTALYLGVVLAIATTMSLLQHWVSKRTA